MKKILFRICIFSSFLVFTSSFGQKKVVASAFSGAGVRAVNDGLLKIPGNTSIAPPSYPVLPSQEEVPIASTPPAKPSTGEYLAFPADPPQALEEAPIASAPPVQPSTGEYLAFPADPPQTVLNSEEEIRAALEQIMFMRDEDNGGDWNFIKNILCFNAATADSHRINLEITNLNLLIERINRIVNILQVESDSPINKQMIAVLALLIVDPYLTLDTVENRITMIKKYRRTIISKTSVEVCNQLFRLLDRFKELLDLLRDYAEITDTNLPPSKIITINRAPKQSHKWIDGSPGNTKYKKLAEEANKMFPADGENQAYFLEIYNVKYKI